MAVITSPRACRAWDLFACEPTERLSSCSYEQGLRRGFTRLTFQTIVALALRLTSAKPHLSLISLPPQLPNHAPRRFDVRQDLADEGLDLEALEALGFLGFATRVKAKYGVQYLPDDEEKAIRAVRVFGGEISSFITPTFSQ